MKKNKVLLFLMFLFFSFNLSAKDVYKIAIDIEFPPFQFRDSKNNLRGIDIDLLKALAKDQNFKYEIQELGFQSSLIALDRGEVDAIFSAMTITEERKKKYDFSKPYVKTGVALATRKNSKISSYEDLRGKVVATRSGTVGYEFIDKLAEKYGFRLVQLDDGVSLTGDVTSRMSDAFFDDTLHIKSSITKDKNIKLVFEEKAYSECGIMLLKGKNQELLDKLNKGLENLEKNGIYKKIMDKYSIDSNSRIKY